MSGGSAFAWRTRGRPAAAFFLEGFLNAGLALDLDFLGGGREGGLDLAAAQVHARQALDLDEYAVADLLHRVFGPAGEDFVGGIARDEEDEIGAAAATFAQSTSILHRSCHLRSAGRSADIGHE